MEWSIGPAHLLRAADVVADALAPHVDGDWSRRAGPMEWDVETTVVHMLGAVVKYTIYVASASPTFVALAVRKAPGATHAELHASIRPVAQALAAACRAAAPGTMALHDARATPPHGFLAMACVELLVHAHDALQGLGDRLRPPGDLVRPVLAAEYPDANPEPDPWLALLSAAGRPPPS